MTLWADNHHIFATDGYMRCVYHSHRAESLTPLLQNPLQLLFSHCVSGLHFSCEKKVVLCILVPCQ